MSREKLKFYDLGAEITRALKKKNSRNEDLAGALHALLGMKVNSLKDYLVKVKQGYLFPGKDKELGRRRLAHILYTGGVEGEVIDRIRSQADSEFEYPPKEGISYVQMQIQQKRVRDSAYQSLQIHPERQATVRKMLALDEEKYLIVQGVIRGLSRLQKERREKLPEEINRRIQFPGRATLTTLVQGESHYHD